MNVDIERWQNMRKVKEKKKGMRIKLDYLLNLTIELEECLISIQLKTSFCCPFLSITNDLCETCFGGLSVYMGS